MSIIHRRKGYDPSLDSSTAAVEAMCLDRARRHGDDDVNRMLRHLAAERDYLSETINRVQRFEVEAVRVSKEPS